jgi:hypothetical protein
MYYISSKTIFLNLQDLVDHYRSKKIKNQISFTFFFCIANIDGLCCLLTRPCRKIEPPIPGDRYGLLELDRCQLLRTELIGKGNYGEVYKGKYGQRDVAIKCMKTDNKNRMCNVDKFLDEAKIMKDLLHKNIVRLYGVCTQEEPIFIVTEFMANGCLLNHLRDGQGKNLKFKTILDFAAQVMILKILIKEKCKRILFRSLMVWHILNKNVMFIVILLVNLILKFKLEKKIQVVVVFFF